MRLIDADALHINITCGRMNEKKEFADAVKAMINEAPTVDAEPVRHGTWKPLYPDLNLYVCSECDGISVGETNYCHHCGAQMDNTQSLSEFK